MTEKELRKHIKPFLRFAIEVLKNDLKRGETDGLCLIANDYDRSIKEHNGTYEISNYLEERLIFARPKDSGTLAYWWIYTKNVDAIQKRIDFCRLQLKIVKP